MYTYYFGFCQTFLTAMFWFSESKSENLGPANHVLPFVILNVRDVIIFCVFRVLDFIGHKKSGHLFNRKYHKKVKKILWLP